jgi:hypothetical protein
MALFRQNLQSRQVKLQKVNRLLDFVITEEITKFEKQTLWVISQLLDRLQELYIDPWSTIMFSTYRCAFGSSEATKEICDICEETIPFDNFQNATCRSEHSFGTYEPLLFFS